MPVYNVLEIIGKENCSGVASYLAKYENDGIKWRWFKAYEIERGLLRNFEAKLQAYNNLLRLKRLERRNTNKQQQQQKFQTKKFDKRYKFLIEELLKIF